MSYGVPMRTAVRPPSHRDILRLTRLPKKTLPLSQPERVQALLEHGSVTDILNEYRPDLALGLDAEEPPSEVERDLQSWRDRGYRVTSIFDDDYPHLLREVHEAPALVYTQGEIVPQEQGVSIVGSRTAPDGALSAAFDLSQELSRQGIPVISGLARGIDTAAHHGALAVGGRTIAVMGTGLDHTYPEENWDLRRRIIDERGLILSQFEPPAGPTKASFPMRNQVMSGYGVATIVMAATEKSGTRHQAQAASAHGRAIIFAGSVAADVSWARDLVA